MDFFIITIVKAAIIAFVLLTALAYIQWVERKVIAHIQLRVGPYRDPEEAGKVRGDLARQGIEVSVVKPQ